MERPGNRARRPDVIASPSVETVHWGNRAQLTPRAFYVFYAGRSRRPQDFFFDDVDCGVLGGARARVGDVSDGRRSPRSEWALRRPSRLSRVASCFALTTSQLEVRRYPGGCEEQYAHA